MKKIIFYLSVIVLSLNGCTGDNKDTGGTGDKNPPQKSAGLSGFDSVPEATVSTWARWYSQNINPEAPAILSVNTSAPVLQGLLSHVTRLKLINGMDPSTDTATVFLQFLIGGKFTYYNIFSFFSRDDPGMRHKAVLCPPPDNCDQLSKLNIDNGVISPDSAEQMAAHYKEVINSNPQKSILQITMDADTLSKFLNHIEGFKMDYASYLNTDSITVILQTWNGKAYTFTDINSVFSSRQLGSGQRPPVCPPPENCGIPFIDYKYKPVTPKKH